MAQKQKYMSMEQDRKPRNNWRSYDQLIHDKGGRNKQRRKDSLFNMVMGKLDSYTQKNKKEYSLTPYTKVNSKYLNVGLDTIKL